MLLALIIFFLCFTIIAWHRFYLALALLFFLLPTYVVRFRLGPLPTTMLEIMLLIIVAVRLACTIRPIGRIRPISPINYTLWVAIALFLLGATISIFTATNTRAALGEWKAFYIEPALLFVVLVSTMGHINPLRPIRPTNVILISLTLSGLITSLLAIYQHFTGFMVPWKFWANGASYRVTGWYGFPNGVGLFLAPLIPLALYQVLTSTKKIKWKIFDFCSFIFSFLFLISAPFAILFAKSTGAIVGVVVGIGLLFLAIRPIGRTRLIGLITVGLISLISLILPIGHIDSIRDELLAQNRSGQIRIAMWHEALQLLTDHPIRGAGLASYDERIAPYHIQVHGENIEIFHHPHNIFLTIWVNTGIIGLIGFIGLIVWFYQAGFTAAKKQLAVNNQQSNHTNSIVLFPLSIFLLSSMTTLLVHGLVDSPYIKNDLAIFFWLLLALMYTSYQSYPSYSSHQSP